MDTKKPLNDKMNSQTLQSGDKINFALKNISKKPSNEIIIIIKTILIDALNNRSEYNFNNRSFL